MLGCAWSGGFVSDLLRAELFSRKKACKKTLKVRGERPLEDFQIEDGQNLVIQFFSSVP